MGPKKWKWKKTVMSVANLWEQVNFTATLKIKKYN